MCSLEDLHEGSKKLILLQVTAWGDEFEVRVGIAAIATNSSPRMKTTLVSLGLALSPWSVLFIPFDLVLRISGVSQIQISKHLLIPSHGSTSEALNHSGSPNYRKSTLSAKRHCQIHVAIR
jgi:hypothetical protein